MSYTSILGVYHLATVSDKEQGQDWYDRADIFARELSAHYNIGRLVVCGVIAALSPRNRWERNMVDAESMVKVAANGGDFDDLMALKVCTFTKNKEKAAKILTLDLIDRSESKIQSILSGPKLIEFFNCILGLSDVCIDGHAYSIWVGDRIALADVPSIGKKLRQSIKADYRKAAEILGVAPHVVQAITWVTWRRLHGI